MARKEGHGEGEHENARHANVPGAVKQLIHDEVPDARAPPALVNRDGPDLRQIVPHNVQRAASGNGAIRGGLGDGELKDVLVKIHRGLVEQPARGDVPVDQPPDYRNVSGARMPHYVLHRGTTVALKYNRAATLGIGARTQKMFHLAISPSQSGVAASGPYHNPAIGAAEQSDRQNGKTSPESADSGICI
jgi:hypothetical protein